MRELGRGAWLTLALMMLLSRAVFQARGAVWMRTFLDAWQSGGVKRAWGAASLAYAALLLVAVALCDGPLSPGDDVVIASVLLVLVADGAVNVLPSGFTTFKDRVQRAWIRRRGGPDDRSLFTVGNVLLALGSLAVAAAVLSYRPVVWETVAAAVLAAAACTAVLLGKSGFLLR